MKKTLFTAALALALSLGGAALSAQETSTDAITLEKDHSLVTLVVESKLDVNLKQSLTTTSETTGTASFGYKKNGTEFVSLVDAMAAVEVANSDNTAKSATLTLGKFQTGDTFQFGYGNSSTFEAFTPTLKVASDAGFHAGYDIDSFYQLDFPKDPFDGRIEIYVMGEPLPASTVTLLVALGAAAVILLYNNRRTRVRCSEQA